MIIRALRRNPAFAQLRRICLLVIRSWPAGLMLLSLGAAAAQPAYPSKSIRVIVPFPPGGGADIAARVIGQRLGENWGQQVIVDNRPGGNTLIGSEALVKSPPDGYTLLVTSSAFVINPFLLPNLPYDSVKDFAPVATISVAELVLVIHPSVPANNLRELIALAKAKPGQLNYASSGTGSTTHLAAEFFNILAGVKTQHIPYKGAGQVMADLVAGQVHMYFNIPIPVIPYIRNARLKGIATTGETRLRTLPQVPTFAEAGLPGQDVKIWFAMFAPAGTPKETVEKLSSEIGKILASPDFKEKLDSQGMEPFISNAEQFATLIRVEMAKYGKIIRTANIKLDN